MATVATTPVRGPQPGSAPSGMGQLTPGGAGQSPQSGVFITGTPQSGNGTASDDSGKSIHHDGRKKLPWGKDVWDRIDKAVEMEMKRILIGRRFIPIKEVSSKTLTVPTDAYALSAGGFTADEGASTRLVTLSSSFSLTPQQIAQETGDTKELGHSTAVTLATRAANALAQAEDLLIFQGQNAFNNPLFVGGPVINQGVPNDTGLLNFAVGAIAPPAGLPAVNPGIGGRPAPGYGTETFTQVTAAMASLVASGNSGPYALVLDTFPYADAYAPIASLAVPADAIKPLMTAGFFGTSALRLYGPPPPPPPVVAAAAAATPPYFGVLVSLGGNTVDLVVGLHATTAILQENAQGNFQLQVIERIALRFKNPPGVVQLQFN